MFWLLGTEIRMRNFFSTQVRKNVFLIRWESYGLVTRSCQIPMGQYWFECVPKASFEDAMVPKSTALGVHPGLFSAGPSITCRSFTLSFSFLVWKWGKCSYLLVVWGTQTVQGRPLAPQSVMWWNSRPGGSCCHHLLLQTALREPCRMQPESK